MQVSGVPSVTMEQGDAMPGLTFAPFHWIVGFHKVIIARPGEMRHVPFFRFRIETTARAFTSAFDGGCTPEALSSVLEQQS